MEIQDIKARLTLATVLHHYNLKPDKNLRLLCPFHEDKTPSLQVYYKTHTAYCFSSNCKTHGKSLDVIDFIKYKENLSKHEAIKKSMEIAGITEPQITNTNNTFDRVQFLTNIYTYFKNAIHNSKPTKEYIKQRGLNHEKIEIGFNSGQFHHGTRKDETLIQNCLTVGLLIDKNLTSRTGEKAYQPFGKYCIVFALRNRANQVTGLYFRSTINEEDAKHYYLKDRSGLYPHYPKAETEKLILTEAIIDAATLLQLPDIIKDYELLSSYGTNGLTKEHITAIKELKNLQEIIFAFDNDEAGNKAAEKYSKELKEILPHIKITKIELTANEDVNSVFTAHEPEIFTHLLENRKDFLFSNEKNKSSETTEKTSKAEQIKTPVQIENKNKLDTKNPYKLSYTTETASYYIQGGISKILDSMKVTLVIEHLQTQQKSRNKIDLYEDKQVEKTCKEVSEKLNLRKDLLEADIYKLTDLLDQYRETEINNNKSNEHLNNEKIYPLTVQERQETEHFLKQQKLIYKFNELLGKSGIAGEDTNRIFLLIIAISYKMPEPLHALIQGSSGSGKTRLLRQISDCIPPERVIRLTRVSDKGFYNYPEKYLKNKLVSLEDVDGLGEDATFAFRELQSNGELSSATSVKQENGQIVSAEKIVKGPIASLACTTQGEMYEDNMSRVFLIAVDESREQTQRIIQYQNNKAAGQIDTRKEQEIKRFIQNMVREIKPYEVINPFANKIQLPEEAHKIRRLNDLFQSFIKMITVINQYQRRKDEKGRLITETEDIETAIDIMFESIVLKVDELDGSLRQFFEKLKKYVEKKSKSFEFTRFDVREATGLGKTQQQHYINKLLELEYLQQYGFANRGFRYKIVFWDDYTKLREQIKTHLHKQLQVLAFTPDRTPNRTPALLKTEALS
ncbi:MAG: hypothetical protein A2491_02495 [Bacteroidetes bacterium RIFOXYC12_FULL_35_7]|nr:MAG: hypothetical protein A2491_02495 [Bacteroidetes bacterium RIFOXYC12_FULL_35_7]